MFSAKLRLSSSKRKSVSMSFKHLSLDVKHLLQPHFPAKAVLLHITLCVGGFSIPVLQGRDIRAAHTRPCMDADHKQAAQTMPGLPRVLSPRHPQFTAAGN